MSNNHLESICDDWAADVAVLRRQMTSAPDWVGALPDFALAALYAHFCNIQAANWLLVKQENTDRFVLWAKSGDDNDAWS